MFPRLFAGLPGFAYTAGYLFAYSYLALSVLFLAVSRESRRGVFGLLRLRIEAAAPGGAARPVPSSSRASVP